MFKFLFKPKEVTPVKVTSNKPHNIILLETLLSHVKYTPTEYAIEFTNNLTANGELSDPESVCLLAADMTLVQITTDMLTQISRRSGSDADRLNISNYDHADLTFPNWPARTYLLSKSIETWFYAGLLSPHNRDDISYSVEALLRFGPYRMRQQQKIINAHVHKQRYEYDRYVLLT